jgi:thiol-disulfide isomerase/thioredoxin
MRVLPVLALIGVLAGLYFRYKVPPQIDLSTLPMETLNGETVKITMNEREKLCLKFFASWCIDCRRELPALVSDTANFKKEKIRLILVSDEPIDQLVFFKQRDSIPFEMLHLKSSFKSVGIHTLPTTYWYDESGLLFRKKTGKSSIIDGFK